MGGAFNALYSVLNVIILLHELQEFKIKDMAVVAIQQQDMRPWIPLGQLLDKLLAPLQKQLWEFIQPLSDTRIITFSGCSSSHSALSLFPLKITIVWV